MSVLIGSARSNENGGITGGAAGDQTGKEVSTQPWYLHSNGWIVIRAKDPAAREKIAHNMESMCANDNIGYCQDHRSTLTVAAKPYGYDASKVNVKVETDCSEGVRNCVLYAGINVSTFSTSGEVSILRSTGAFDILEDDLHCKSSDYLLRGDILVTRTKGHTIVVLTNGAKAGILSTSTEVEVAQKQPNASVGTPKKGEIVYFTGGNHYASANALLGVACFPGSAKVTKISIGSKHPYHLVHTDNQSNVYGWVDAANIVETRASAGSESIQHIIKKGDTLYAIAKKYGTSVNSIVQLNGIANANKIYVGQEIRVK